MRNKDALARNQWIGNWADPRK